MYVYGYIYIYIYIYTYRLREKEGMCVCQWESREDADIVRGEGDNIGLVIRESLSYGPLSLPFPFSDARTPFPW